MNLNPKPTNKLSFLYKYKIKNGKDAAKNVCVCSSQLLAKSCRSLHLKSLLRAFLLSRGFSFIVQFTLQIGVNYQVMMLQCTCINSLPSFILKPSRPLKKRERETFHPQFQFSQFHIFPRIVLPGHSD